MTHLAEAVEIAKMGRDNNNSLAEYFLEPEIQKIEHEFMETYQEMRISSDPSSLQGRLEYLAKRNSALLRCKQEIQHTVITFEEILRCLGD